MTQQKKLLGKILEEMKVVTAVQIKAALKAQMADPGRKIGELLIEAKAATTAQITEALARQYNYPYVDLKALGFTVLAFTTLEIAQGQEAAVIDAVARIPEVLEVHKTTGPGDLLCRVVARTNEHLHDVLEAVLATPGITRTTTALALTSPVQRSVAYALPAGLLDRAS